MNRLVTIVYKNEKVETVMVTGSRGHCENSAFEFADRILGLTDESEKSQVELFFHEDARAQVLFQDILVYRGDK